jgi:hypothetical protein
MKRSVRNGVAIAGMVGGFWLLGQAVAQAEQVNDVGQENNQSASSEDGGLTGNVAGNFNSSENKTEVDIETDVDGGDGGANYSNVNTGVQGAVIVVVAEDRQRPPIEASSVPNGNHYGSSDATGVVHIETGDVYVEQNANGGNVDDSGNVNDLPRLPDQTNNVHQSNNQSATSEDDGWKGPRKDGGYDGGPMSLNGMGGGHGGLTGNLAGNFNSSENKTEIDIETDVEGGDGGENYSNVNTGLQGVFFKCIAVGGGDAKCKVDIETGSVTVIQNANGGNVSDSGNVGDGKGRHDGKDDGKGDRPGKKDDCPGDKGDRPDKVRPDKAPAPAAPVSFTSDKQPTGELAFTGADVSLPLTAGLLALGLGVGLTAAGRRRATQLG